MNEQEVAKLVTMANACYEVKFHLKHPVGGLECVLHKWERVGRSTQARGDTAHRGSVSAAGRQAGLSAPARRGGGGHLWQQDGRFCDARANLEALADGRPG